MSESRAALWLVLLLLGALACAGDDPREPNDGSVAPSSTRPLPADDVPAPPSAAELQAAQTRILQLVDSVDGRLRTVRALTGAERGRLRRDVNERQVERARRLGVGRGTPLPEAVRAGRLVMLQDTTESWTVRELDYSEPYLTPATEALLEEVARRFQARLDTLGVPRFRLDITSVLRTPEKQAALRRANANASRVESAHEFGTTLDIAYRRFAPPAQYEDSFGTHAASRLLADSLLAETARLRGAELQALLGRVLLELQHEGKVLVMMERRQTVFHITVGRRLPPVRRQG